MWLKPVFPGMLTHESGIQGYWRSPSSALTDDVTGFRMNVHLRRRGRPAQLSVRAKEEATRLLLTLIRQGLQDRDGLLSQPEHMREHKHVYIFHSRPACLPTHKQMCTVDPGITQRGPGYCPARFNNELYAEHIKFCLCSISTVWMQWIRTGYPATTGLPFSFHAIKKSLFLIVLQFAAEIFKYVSGGMTNIITSDQHRDASHK